MKKIAIIIAAAVVVTLSTPANASVGRPFAYGGFSGGMMLHAGWAAGGRMSLTTPSGAVAGGQDVRGVPVGIGGSVKLHLGDHLRVGTEGYGTYLSYGGGTGSRISIGWAGALVDWQWHAGKLHPFAGVTIGGGVLRNNTLLDHAYEDFVLEQNMSYRKYSFMAVTPFVGLEVEIGSRVRLAFKADWLINASRYRPDFPSGIRLYVGFIFYHGSRQ